MFILLSSIFLPLILLGGGAVVKAKKVGALIRKPTPSTPKKTIVKTPEKVKIGNNIGKAVGGVTLGGGILYYLNEKKGTILSAVLLIAGATIILKGSKK